MKTIAMMLLLCASLAVGGGYGGDPVPPYSIEIWANFKESYVYYTAPVSEVNVTLEEPGEAWVYTRKVNRAGQVFEAKEPMFTTDGISFSYSYNPPIVMAVEYEGRASYYYAARHH